MMSLGPSRGLTGSDVDSLPIRASRLQLPSTPKNSRPPLHSTRSDCRPLALRVRQKYTSRAASPHRLISLLPRNLDPPLVTRLRYHERLSSSTCSVRCPQEAPRRRCRESTPLGNRSLLLSGLCLNLLACARSSLLSVLQSESSAAGSKICTQR